MKRIIISTVLVYLIVAVKSAPSGSKDTDKYSDYVYMKPLAPKSSWSTRQDLDRKFNQMPSSKGTSSNHNGSKNTGKYSDYVYMKPVAPKSSWSTRQDLDRKFNQMPSSAGISSNYDGMNKRPKTYDSYSSSSRSQSKKESGKYSSEYVNINSLGSKSSSYWKDAEKNSKLASSSNGWKSNNSQLPYKSSSQSKKEKDYGSNSNSWKLQTTSGSRNGFMKIPTMVPFKLFGR